MSDGVKYTLRSKNGYAWSFIGTNGIQSHPPTYTLIADRLLMRFMTQPCQMLPWTIHSHPWIAR